jgi:alanine racemase
MPDPTRARLTIDLDALAHNFAVLRAEAPGTEAAPVVKSDGYGLGAGAIARRLWAEGARGFFVARLDEAEALRAALGPDRPAAIYVLDGLLTGTAPRFDAAGLTPVLSTLPQVSAAAAWAAATGTKQVVLHVDTGMNRQGLTLPEARALADAPGGLRGLDVVLLMSHLGSAAEPGDPRSNRQLEAFEAVRALFPGARTSLAASAGVFLGPDYHCDLIRPGVSLYGGGPLERPDGRLKAVATLTAPLVDIRNLRPGDRVGYGEAFTAERPTRVAIVAAGYTDGVVRAAKGRARAWCAGGLHRILVVTMDLLVIELDDAHVAIGEHVELVGPHALLDDLAEAAGTVAHEILVRLSPRAERVYLGEA